MDSVTIFPVTSTSGGTAFRAVAGMAQSEGKTAGEALDAIRVHLPAGTSGTLVVIQPFQPDNSFTAEQQSRLTALMDEWRAARDAGQKLAPEKQTELDTLVKQELLAAEIRTRQVLQGLEVNRRYLAVAARAGHRCEYCHAPEAVFNLPFEVEHVIPRTYGGSNDDENLALACRSCNVFKSDCIELRAGASDRVIPPFNPRTDDWHAHFAISEVGAVVGNSEIGQPRWSDFG